MLSLLKISVHGLGGAVASFVQKLPAARACRLRDCFGTSEKWWAHARVRADLRITPVDEAIGKNVL
ncbi:MAG: hypothetical protein ACLT98_09455 [Eggerthellaceae bacterium]